MGMGGSGTAAPGAAASSASAARAALGDRSLLELTVASRGSGTTSDRGDDVRVRGGGRSPSPVRAGRRGHGVQPHP